MNAERLQAVLNAIRTDFANHDLASLVSNVASAYSQSLSSPSEAAIRGVDVQLADLSNATAASATALLPPSMGRILGHIGGSDLVGSGLADRVSVIIAENQGTPARAVVALEELAKRVTAFQQSVAQGYLALEALSVAPETLPLGSCEVGVAVPEEIVSSSLGGFQRKLGEFDRTIRTFAEVAGEDVASPPLTDLGRGSYEFFVHVHPLTAAAIVTAIERSVALYKQILEIRQLRANLEQKNVPTSALEGIKAHEASLIDAEVKKARDEILELYDGDKGRKNELRTALAVAVKFLVGQIDKGVDVEVTCHDPSPTSVPGDDEQNEGPKSLFRAYKRVMVGGSAIRDLPADRTPLLFLPATTSEPPAPDDPGEALKSRQTKLSK